MSNKKKNKKIDAAGRISGKSAVTKAYWGLASAYDLDDPWGISVEITEKGYHFAMLELSKVYLSPKASDRIAQSKGIDPRTDFIGSGLHECGHIFAFELKSKNPEAYTELADAVEDEGRSESEAIADAFVGIALALSEEDPKALADFPACAELAAPGVIRPVTIPRSKFMSELAASQDAVGCIETATTRCEEHQTGPIRSLNTGIGYQLGKGLLVEVEDEHDADELLDGGDSDELLDGGDDDGQDGFGSQWEWQAA